ncbi:PAS domain-containing sensor histidine kinase [bacterium]|nr:PAS domain-containing sensor histidine kinase [bacterium]
MVFKNLLAKTKEIDILGNIPDGILLISGDGKVNWSNEIASTVLNFEKTALVGANISDVFEGGFELVKQAALSGEAVVGRLNNLPKEMFLEITAKYVEDCLVATFRDVTKNYKTVTSILEEHEHSKKNSKDKNVFLVKMANELKTPVHSVVGFSQAMVDGLGGEMTDKQSKYIRIINKNSNELLYLMDKLIEFSTVEASMFEKEFQIFDGINTVQNVFKTFETLAISKNLTATFDSAEITKRTVFSVEPLLKIILTNILETSLKATDIGSITLSVVNPELELVAQQQINVPEDATEKSYLMLSVSDTGSGYNDTDLEDIFNPYSMLDKPNKKNLVRSLALSTAYQLVKYLKGDIWIKSSPMQGSVYNVIIPVEKFA